MTYLHLLSVALYFHYMRYQTDPMTKNREKWLRSRKVSILDIFWRLIMQKWDFSGTWDLLQMLLSTLYFHYVRYRTDPRTQFRENWLRSQKKIDQKKSNIQYEHRWGLSSIVFLYAHHHVSFRVEIFTNRFADAKSMLCKSSIERFKEY